MFPFYKLLAEDRGYPWSFRLSWTAVLYHPRELVGVSWTSVCFHPFPGVTWFTAAFRKSYAHSFSSLRSTLLRLEVETLRGELGGPFSSGDSLLSLHPFSLLGQATR